MKLVNSIIVIILVIFLTSCKTLQNSQLNPPSAAISPKMPALEKNIETYSNAVVISNPMELKVYSSEVDENLTNPYGEKFGYISFKTTYNVTGQGMGWLLLNGFTGCVLTLFGVPLMKASFNLDVEIQITNSKHQLIGKYNGSGKAHEMVALYWGYSMIDAQKLALTTALKNALGEIRPKIQADVARLNEEFTKAGKINY